MFTVEQKYLLKQFEFSSPEDLIKQLQEAYKNSDKNGKDYIVDLIAELSTEEGRKECMQICNLTNALN